MEINAKDLMYRVCGKKRRSVQLKVDGLMVVVSLCSLINRRIFHSLESKHDNVEDETKSPIIDDFDSQ